MVKIPIKTPDVAIQIEKLPHCNATIIQRRQAILNAYIVQRAACDASARNHSIDVGGVIVHRGAHAILISGVIAQGFQRGNRNLSTLLLQFSTGFEYWIKSCRTARQVGNRVPDTKT